jgi:type VI secretion system protein ImpM
MPCALFGKTPTKRDFIAPGVPRGFLDVWEPWMQAGLSSSRHALDAAWQARFLRAPLWRFWLGPQLCGATYLGAFMPSLDGIGRYYPLTILALPGEGDAFATPDVDLHAAWFEAAENFLLSTLEAAMTFDDIEAQLALLPEPQGFRPAGGAERLIAIAESCRFAQPSDGLATTLFQQFRDADWLTLHGRRSYWWTQGGEEFPVQALAATGMPPPECFAGLLTGELGTTSQPALA